MICKSLVFRNKNHIGVRRHFLIRPDAIPLHVDRIPFSDRHLYLAHRQSSPQTLQTKRIPKCDNDEASSLRHEGRFGAGLPRVNDGPLLFLQPMIVKMRPRRWVAAASASSSMARRSSPATPAPARARFDAGSRERLARGHRRSARAALQQYRHLYLPADIDQSESSGNKRRKIGDPKTGRPEDARDPDHIGNLSPASANTGAASSLGRADPVKLGDEVEIEYYRIKSIETGAINVREGVQSPKDFGIGKSPETRTPLSEII